jgi:linoleoyl-CoA desaturase
LILFKALYYVLFIGIAIKFSPYSTLEILFGFLSMHLLAGFILGIVFQPAHISTNAEFPETNEEDNIVNSWAGHQLITTQNFAMNNRWLSWYVGGLNFQIEHHLFPTISHIHFRELSKIVQEVVKDYDLPYYSQPTWRSAIQDHAKMLARLGRS